ncbi:GNAT family N-acetyltransferase [Piscibacillus salipiscarius]|uniref:GNAT family N-acetyltransferase n=1 Tax=Piscibacillus salipiscarius TaxID=299480 RepID=A0ABW5QAP8_9BACI|nr:GNAT family N-acetyltransferase [Piscibacillus salipiscarius]
MSWKGEDSTFFQNGDLEVRPLNQMDIPSLAKWLSDHRVLEYYEDRDQSFDAEQVRENFFIKDSDTVRCMVLFKGKRIGYIQFYEAENEFIEEHGYMGQKVYGIDQFIGEPTYWNKGIGSLLVSSMVSFLIYKKGADVVVMDPQVRNTRALRCYEKCGFDKVKVLPEHELHEGVYQDCWLMEYKSLELNEYR